jgi:hypothetical protein
LFGSPKQRTFWKKFAVPEKHSIRAHQPETLH